MSALLPNRTVVVTGAGNGIGAAIAARCAGEGANVALLDVNEEAAVQVADDIGLPDRLLAMHADVTRAGDVHAAVASVIDRFGRIDSLINNAGISAYFDAGVMTEQQWEDVLGVDLKGAWLCTRAVIAPMRAQRSGSIVNIASIHTKLTSAGMFPYAVAKSGLIGLTHSLALDLAPDGIRVNAVSPGWTRTALVQEWLDRQADPVAAEAEVLRAHPMGRICTPEEVAAVVAFVTSDQASGITGAEIRVDAGLAVRMAS
jgi:NAD(P)-dependent dehydrogenase (short-subunit alcohol dehydrogenase family)